MHDFAKSFENFRAPTGGLRDGLWFPLAFPETLSSIGGIAFSERSGTRPA